MQRLIESRWFKEGQKAREEGQTAEQCPYGGGSPKALLWHAGFESAPFVPEPILDLAPITLADGEQVI